MRVQTCRANKYWQQENIIKFCRINASVSDRELVQRFCEHGLILIDSAGLSMEQAEAWFLGLERHFGTIIVDKSTPEGWYRVSDKGTDADSRFLADGSAQFSLHTDRAFSAMPPPYIGLLCEAAASSGGESLLADAAGLYQHILSGAGSEALASLFEPFYTLRRSPHEVQRPLFFYNDHRQSCFAYRGKDAATEVSFRPEFAALMRLAEAFLADPANTEQIQLEPGQILLIDNHRYLHGRSKFQGQRLLYRLYFSGRNSEAPVTGFAGDGHVDRMVQERGLHRWVSDKAESLPHTV